MLHSMVLEILLMQLKELPVEFSATLKEETKG
jgi:hypothetical protein